jgi:hypothetical protein
MELTDAEIEQEMDTLFGPMYDTILKNINNDLRKVLNYLSK